MKNDENRWLILSGIVGILTPVIAFTCISLAVSSYPSFSWTENALSDLGVQSGLTAPLFNYGLIASGLSALIFAAGLFSYLGKRSLGKLGATIFVLATVALISIGSFPESVEPIHHYVSVAFFLLVPVAMLAIVAAFTQSNEPRLAWLTLFAALIAAAPWILQYGLNYFPNVAIPETISAVSASVWSIVVGLDMIREQRSNTKRTSNAIKVSEKTG